VVKNTARYDTVFSYSNELCLSPKKLFNYFSVVADKGGECMPTSVLEAPSPMPCVDIHVRMGREEGGVAAATSIMHGGRSQRHAGAVQEQQLGWVNAAAQARPASPASPPLPSVATSPDGIVA
jgi:hypothetical protein